MVFHNNNSLFCEILLSLPLRERGLKLMTEEHYDCESKVAPFAGAWIEIHVSYGIFVKEYSRSLCGSVD